MPPRDWDAETYDRVASPMEAMGREVLLRLELEGDETVLDAGCGTGRVTALLAERLPRGRVIAVDGSPAMVEEARARLPLERVEVRVADLAALELEEPAAAILSTATFHWIGDHDRLFARLHAALKPGGRLVAQCGGAGNIADVRAALADVMAREPFASAFGGWEGPWNFAAPAETERRLRRAGFAEAWCWRSYWPVEVEDWRAFFGTLMLGAHLDRLPAELHDPFLDAVHDALDHPLRVDYVRLNILARRG